MATSRETMRVHAGRRGVFRFEVDTVGGAALLAKLFQEPGGRQLLQHLGDVRGMGGGQLLEAGGSR
jgi:hypothetical protein